MPMPTPEEEAAVLALDAYIDACKDVSGRLADRPAKGTTGTPGSLENDRALRRAEDACRAAFDRLRTAFVASGADRLASARHGLAAYRDGGNIAVRKPPRPGPRPKSRPKTRTDPAPGSQP
jgi:hypothetical protein